MPFVQSSQRYYESNFEAMLKNWSLQWYFCGWWHHYNVSLFYVIILRLAFGIPIPCYACHYLLRVLLLPFAQSLWRYMYYESNFEVMLKKLSLQWSFQGCWHYYNAGIFYVIILRLAFMIPCKMLCFSYNINAFHLMLIAILCACNLFWEFTFGFNF